MKLDEWHISDIVNGFFKIKYKHDAIWSETLIKNISYVNFKKIIDIEMGCDIEIETVGGFGDITSTELLKNYREYFSNVL